MTSSGIAFNRAIQLVPLIDLFEQRGGKTDTALRAAGLPPSVLSDPTALITGNALYQVMNEMAKVLGDPFFAARAAEKFVKAGPVQLRNSFTASHTLAEFLPLAVLEIDRQVSNVCYSLQIRTTSTVIEVERTFKPVVPIVQADAAIASIWVTLLRLVLADDFDPSGISLTVQEIAGIPSDLVPRSSVLRRRWNGVQIRFPSQWLQRPLNLDWQIPPTNRGEFDNTSHRELVMKWLERMCLEELGKRSFSMQDLAHRLDVHPKSLQRTFNKMGTSFQEIRDQARKEKALEILIKDRSVPNQEVAELLGFTSAASFSRAFKRWTGITPTEFRHSL